MALRRTQGRVPVPWIAILLGAAFLSELIYRTGNVNEGNRLPLQQEETGETEDRVRLRCLCFLLVTPAMAGGSNRLKSIDDENCPFNI